MSLMRAIRWRTRWRGALLSAAASLSAALAVPACASEGEADTSPTAIPDVPVEAVPVIADPATLGRVQAIAELPSSYVAFGDRGATRVSGGLPAGTDGIVKSWSSGSAIPSADRTGPWPVAIDDGGRLLRLRDDLRIEDVRSRYGLGPEEKVKRAVPTGDGGTLALVLDDAVVVVDTNYATTKRWALGPLERVAAIPGRVAGVTGAVVHVLDLALGKELQYPVAITSSETVQATAFDEQRRVLVLTDRHLYREADRELSLLFEAPGGAPLHNLAATPRRIWFGAGTDLFLVEGGGVRHAVGAALEPDTQLAGSPSGDVWLLGPKLGRLKATAVAADKEALFNAKVLPIYQSVCKDCHAPGGSAGIDLSTHAAWLGRKAAIGDRVIAKKTMPPPPRVLAADQVAAIASWLD